MKKDVDTYKEEEYAFDACYGDLTGQEEIFEDTKMLMQSAIDGFTYAYSRMVRQDPERPTSFRDKNKNQVLCPGL